MPQKKFLTKSYKCSYFLIKCLKGSLIIDKNKLIVNDKFPYK